jgi:hypothetical protein
MAAAPGVLAPDAFKALMPFAGLRPYDKNVDCRFIVLAPPTDVHVAKEGGTVYTFLVADESAAMLATFWDEQGAALRAGDVVLMRGGLVTLFRGHMRLACKRQGSLLRIDRVRLLFRETPNVSETLWVPHPERPHELMPAEAPVPGPLSKHARTR